MKHKSLFGLFATHSLPKILLLCFVMTVLQLYSFLRDPISTSYIISNQEIPLFSYMLATFLSIFFCSLHGTLKDGTYTLLRLGLSKRDIFHVLALNQFCSLFLIWGTQAFIFMLARGILNVNSPESSFLYLFYLDSWQSSFFHLVLPTLDFYGWMEIFLRNLLLAFLGATISLKVFTSQKRNKYYVFLLLIMATYVDIAGGIFYQIHYHIMNYYDSTSDIYQLLTVSVDNWPKIISISYCLLFGISTLFLFLGGKKYDKN